jgi:hypothetical protein
MRLALVLVLLSGCFLFRSGDSASCPKDRAADLGLQEDVKKLAGCTQAASVIIRTGATIDLAPLKELEEITGDLTIGPTIGIDEASFNGLLRVGGTIRVANNSSLRGLFLPRIEQIGRFEVDNNAVLTSISTPRLTTVTGAMVITDNGHLELISAPLLQNVGKELVISGHSKLNLIEMGRLTSVETIRVEGNPKLSPELVEQLTSKSAIKNEPVPKSEPPKPEAAPAGSNAPPT